MPLISSLGILNALGFGFSSASPLLAIASSIGNTAPYLRASKWQGGFSSAYTNPASAGFSISGSPVFNPNNTAIACGISGGSFTKAYPFNVTTGFGTAYSGGAVTGLGTGACFSPSNSAIAFSFGGTTSPMTKVYRWSSSGFGTAYPAPSTTITSQTRTVNFTSDGTAIIYGGGASPRIHAYAWTTASGFGTKFADPASTPTGTTMYSVSISPSSTVLMLGCSATLQAYRWSSSGFGTKFTNPSPGPGGAFAIYTNCFNSAEDSVFCGWDANAPFMCAFRWSSAGFGTKYTALSPAMTADVTRITTNTTKGVMTVLINSSAYDWNSGFGAKYSGSALGNNNSFSN